MSQWISTPGSSNVAGFSYDEGNQILTVEFTNGSRYDYYDIPDHKFDAIKVADSVGKYLNAEIKGKHRYSRH